MAKVDDPFAMSNVLSTAGLVAIIINSLIVVRYGRRRVLLMTGLIGCGFIQLIVAIVYQQQPGRPATGKVIVGLSCVYMMVYNGMIVSICLHFNRAPIADTHPGNLRMAFGRRTSFSAPAFAHFWTRCCRWLRFRLAHHIYGSGNYSALFSW